ncbi:Orotate phosphoribosyltransferase [Butyrivibrio fibrisolvens]|uniref:Orotate phosphoribosyltransferase n=1 Tax=Butyrivibrio fibrisolvens TaxID=831 RepID=A0A1H9RPL3_BUTFI|nr:phosphoribosyltransferase domain-containing protein [Butyrivibrio fibrisolvens]SER74901.1 Orotate phosphoribosyltransferase [Butyrivibrio fibrisolvens]
MKKYTERELLRIAKRFHNTKRTYLLVDPLQGKHIPVNPSDAMDMLHSLGELVKKSYGESRLVIGFAETATAVGMAVSEVIGDDCVYIHTTREDIPSEAYWIEFKEEHSHATDQKLAASNLKKWLSKTDTIVFVDDEISTGKTIINFINQLRIYYPEISEKKLVAASIINRVSKENNEKMLSLGIESIYILKMDETDLTEYVKKYSICEAQEYEDNADQTACDEFVCDTGLLDPRLGVNTGDYRNNCQLFARKLHSFIDLDKTMGKVLVLGTEECMYPAIILGKMLQEEFNADVYTHSTTRSPIGICQDADYPIKQGYKIKSYYDSERSTYIYNIDKYDLVIIVTDSKLVNPGETNSLIEVLKREGNNRIVLYRG